MPFTFGKHVHLGPFGLTVTNRGWDLWCGWRWFRLGWHRGPYLQVGARGFFWRYSFRGKEPWHPER